MEISVTALETVSPTLLQSVYSCGSQSPPLLCTPTEGREFLIHSLGRNKTNFYVGDFSKGAEHACFSTFLRPSQIYLPVGREGTLVN